MTSLAQSIADFRAKKEACLKFLDQCADLRAAFDESFPEFADAGSSEKPAEAGDGARFTLAAIRAAADRVADEQLKILFAGQFKTGKSTIINAMLGAEALPADVTPCTAVITEVAWGEKPAATLYFRENLPPQTLDDDLDPQVAAHLAAHGLESAPPLELDLSDAQSLNQCLTINLGKEQMSGVRESPFARCRLRWPLDLLRDGAMIIDSPGLNEAETRERATMGYLASADMIVHVLMALQLCGVPDRQFMDAARHVGRPIIFAVNRFDNLNTDRDRQQLKAAALKNQHLLNGSYGADGIFFTSGKMALDARLAGDAAALAQSGLPDLESKIADVFANDRPAIKLAAIASICDDLQIFAAENLPELSRQLGSRADILQREYADHKQRFDALEKRVERMMAVTRRNLDRFSDDFCMRLLTFLNSVASGELDRICADAQLPPIAMFSCKEDSEACVRVLSDAVWAGLKEALINWLNSEGAKICEHWRNEMASDIHADMESFNHSLSLLRREMNPGQINLPQKAVDIDIDVFLARIGNIGMAVGGIGAGLVFVGERFLPMLIGGPMGWIIAIGATVISIVWAACASNEAAQAKVRAEFLKNARPLLAEEIPRMAENITLDARDVMRDELWPIFASLKREIDDVKRPIESAIAIVGRNRQNLEAKKAELKRFMAEFDKLNERGKQLVAAILPQCAKDGEPA